VDTLISASKISKTVAFANASPDGKYILCSMADHGVFTSWNKESDLYLYDFATGNLKPLSGSNSNDSESYNTWSSNSRWIVFSSRRMDTHYNRPHITYMSADGKTTKAFVLPQYDPDFYTMFLKIYNRPELISGPVTINPYEIEKVIKDTIIQKVTFKQ
jgi:Tol biopolymer transport system component